jgi:hypothetical protein
VTTAARRSRRGSLPLEYYPFTTSQMSVTANTSPRSDTVRLQCRILNNSRASGTGAAKLMTRPKSVAQLSSSLEEWIVAFAVIGVTSKLEKTGRVVAYSMFVGWSSQGCLQRRALLLQAFMRL